MPAGKPQFAWSPRDWPSERPFQHPELWESWCYTDRFSYFPGDTVRFHMNSNAPRCSLRIERDDTAAPVLAQWPELRVPRSHTPEDAHAKGCDWPVCLEYALPANLPSGFYLVRLETPQADGAVAASEHFFAVRTRPGDCRPGVLVLTTSTLLAYNDWGGANHYRGLGPAPHHAEGSPVASARRPIARGMLAKPEGAPREFHRDTPGVGAAPRYEAYAWARLHGYSRHHADSFWATYERPFVHWARQAGYDFDFLTQTDLHYDPQCLDGYRCAVVVGHDEYWSWEMRDRLDAFVDRGGRFARFGGNFQWQVRLGDSGDTQYCYRLPSLDPAAAQDPRRATTLWEAKCVARPGASSVGLNGMGGIYTRYGVATPRASGGFTVYRPEHWAFAGTDLYYGDVLGGAPTCLAAFEVDSVEYTFHRGLPYPTGEDGAPDGLEILALCPAVRGEEDRFGGRVPIGGPEYELEDYLDALGDDVPAYLREGGMRGAGMIAAFHRGAGEVFNGGSTEWPQALASGDPFVTRVARNVLDRFLAEP